MGYMFYYNLAGDLFDDKTGNQTAVGGEELTGIQPAYWSGTERGSGTAWFFEFGSGQQGISSNPTPLSAWAVRPGDVGTAAVPEPASLALLGIALGVLGLSRRRRKT